MTDRLHALSLLKQAIGSQAADFRHGQWEAIDALVNRRERCLVVQRTGWGKSMVYFVATKILRSQGGGPTLIVSPLLALMRNQIDAAQRLGIRAATINSTNRNEWAASKQDLLQNTTDVLLISPERLANDDFVQDVLTPMAEHVGLFVVDETHCISDWGHDFRPDYRRLVNVIQRIPGNVPILGTTATANDRVIQDIQRQLGDLVVQRGPLMRETLALQTIRLPSQTERLAWLVDHINELPGTGIIYTLTKRDANRVADWLKEHRISAEAYYSDVTDDGFKDSNSYRQHLEQRLLDNELKALVATTALGMGYDKPDLGFVVHYQTPSSIVAYYQQVGRAGREIPYALGVLMSGNEDDDIHEFFRRSAFPSETSVQSVLRALESHDGLTVRELEAIVNLRNGQIEHLLKYLSVENPAPVIKVDSTWRRTPVQYQMDREKIRRLTLQREVEWQEIQRYIDESGCLMKRLAEALDDTTSQECGKCTCCLGRPLVSPSFNRETAIAAARFVRHSEFPLECRKQVPQGAFTYYDLRGNLPKHLQAEEGRTLSRWGDAGWGRVIAESKDAGRLPDELVDAVVTMLEERWLPSPPPTWVTCVPSMRNPDLVPDYARRLTALLGLTFMPAVAKIRENKPQKEQQNRFHQCQNLDGVFAIQGSIPNGPVLLVDDVTDSGWTLTIVAALLRQAGSGPVYPLALASSNPGG